MAVNCAIDASSVINLNNAGALPTICKLKRCRLWLSPIVVSECEPTCAATILQLQQTDAIGFVDDDKVPGELFLSLLSEHELGEGETESIAVSKTLGYQLCCDDKKARAVAEEILGPSSVVGSLRLLRWCVEEKLLACTRAYEIFIKIKATGGFVPQTPQEFFCEGVEGC